MARSVIDVIICTVFDYRKLKEMVTVIEKLFLRGDLGVLNIAEDPASVDKWTPLEVRKTFQCTGKPLLGATVIMATPTKWSVNFF